jgi:hypothetical protein
MFQFHNVIKFLVNLANEIVDFRQIVIQMCRMIDVRLMIPTQRKGQVILTHCWFPLFDLGHGTVLINEFFPGCEIVIITLVHKEMVGTDGSRDRFPQDRKQT